MIEIERAREYLLKHARSQKNGVWPDLQNFSGKLTNPICGDHVEIALYYLDGAIKEAGFSAKACSICTASASMLCDLIPGQSRKSSLQLSQIFEDALVQSIETRWPLEIKSLEAFEHLKINVQRRPCALLPWILLKKILRSVNN